MRSFRRSVVTPLLCLATLWALLPTPAHASEAGATSQGASVRVFQTSSVDGLRRENGDLYWYLAGASHSVDPAGQTTATRAWAARSKCVEVREEGFHIIICMISTRGKKIPAEDFEFDPLMSTADLRFRNTRLHWTANEDEPPYPDVLPFADPNFGAFVYASLDRYGIAEGRILGRKFDFRSRGWDLAYLSTGAFAFGTVATAERKMWVDEDGRIQARLELKIPR